MIRSSTFSTNKQTYLLFFCWEYFIMRYLALSADKAASNQIERARAFWCNNDYTWAFSTQLALEVTF